MFGAPGEYFSWPAIRTDASGNLYVSLTRTSPEIFAEARAAGRRAGDPRNTMSGSVLLRAGEVVHTSGRWGDYLGAAVDPEPRPSFMPGCTKSSARSAASCLSFSRSIVVRRGNFARNPRNGPGS